MTPTITPRLSLVADTAGETNIDGNSPNWKAVDHAAGVIYTTKGVNVPNAQLYDGAIVAERDTGISWICKTDGAGGFTKQYLNYPYLCIGYTANRAVATNAAYIARGWTTIDGTGSINSTIADLPGGFWTCPVKGLYLATGMHRWQNTSTAGRRGGYYTLNGAIMTETELFQTPNASDVTALNIRCQKIFNAGDILGTFAYQNSGVDQNLYSSVYIQMLRPVN